MRPYYEQDGITIYHGDCREVLRLLEGFIGFDAVITDPPYGINHKSSHYASWDGTSIAGDTDTTIRDLIMDRFQGIPAAVFGTWKTPPIRHVRGVLIWDKGPAFGMGDLAFPWKPSWEMIYIRGDGWKGSRDEGVRRGPVEVLSWESSGRCHPHQKPTWLLNYLLRKLPDAETILDPFMGVGTTLIAAKDLGRRAIGIEIEERYCEIAAKRLAKGVFAFEDV